MSCICHYSRIKFLYLKILLCQSSLNGKVSQRAILSFSDSGGWGVIAFALVFWRKKIPFKFSFFFLYLGFFKASFTNTFHCFSWHFCFCFCRQDDCHVVVFNPVKMSDLVHATNFNFDKLENFSTQQTLVYECNTFSAFDMISSKLCFSF